MATITATRPPSSKRKKEAQRTEIWTSLLRQTREAQARSETSTLQHRDLLIFGGTPEDQAHFVERYIARPPPQPPAAANQQGRNRDVGRRKGEVRLSNRFAYGYGHVTLFSPPVTSPQGGAGLLGGESEEVARVECHCFAGGAEGGYEETLRRLLEHKSKGEHEQDEVEELATEGGEGQGRRPSVALLLSWHHPWLFLSALRQWFALLARSLLPPTAPKDENPIETLREHNINITVTLQHVEAQEELEREGYKDDTFDYISQCLRTSLLPLSAALLYTPSSPPPTQPGAPLSEAQKVMYTSMGLDIAALQPRTSARPGSAGTGAQKREDLLPRHNVVDRMAIVVPSGWDSLGKIRLLSETFSPEAVLEGWTADMERSVASFNPPRVLLPDTSVQPNGQEELTDADGNGVLQATGGGGEMYSSQPSPVLDPTMPSSPPLSPSKMPKSAITPYEQLIQDPNAHKAPKAPQLEVTTMPEQEFLSEMRTQLQQFEEQDKERQKREASSVSTTAGALRHSNVGAGDATSGALSELGDVSFNVGGVSYNTVSAEAAIERLKRPQLSSSSDGGVVSPTSRSGTPKPPRRDDGGRETPNTASRTELQTDKLEEYFASLMKRGGGGSAQGTPSKPPPS